MNADTLENYPWDEENFQNEKPGSKGQQKAASPSARPITDKAGPDYGSDLNLEQTGSPYDSEHLDGESDSQSKDITEKDIEKDLRDNDPSQGFETDIQKSNEDESDTFETLEPEKDNPVNKEFEIGQLGNEELQEDERARDETDGAAARIYKPSQRKF